MVAIKAFSILAVAGSVLAAPANQVGSALEARGYNGPKNYGLNYKWGDNKPSPTEGEKKPNVVVENKNVYVTEYVTVPWGQKPSRPTGAPAQPQQPKPTQPQQPTQPEQPAEEPKTWQDAPAPSSSSAPAPPSGGSDTGYMGIVNEYRGKMGLPSLAQDSKLEANALDTSKSSGGALKHKLNSGSFGQVMAPGEDTLDKFEHVFVGGWICEIPSLLPGGECTEQSKGWNYQGQTGHAKILTDTKYTKIGCACALDIWTCDVA